MLGYDSDIKIVKNYCFLDILINYAFVYNLNTSVSYGTLLVKLGLKDGFRKNFNPILAKTNKYPNHNEVS